MVLIALLASSGCSRSTLPQSAHSPPARDELDKMKPGEAYWELIEPHWERVSIYDGPDDFLREYERTPERARHLLVTHWCVSEVANGGFHQFFYNDTGVLAPEAARGFDAICLPKLASTVRDAMRFFGDVYPRKRELRMEPLTGRDADEESPDSLEHFEPLDDRFYNLMVTEGGGWEQAADAYARSGA
jgi:hypothetical protein